MQYTLWSHGRLLGGTDLAFARCFPKLRVGFFHPNDLGERLMPIACGVSPALHELSRLTRRLIPNRHVTRRRTWDLETVLRSSTEYADVAAAGAQEEGLELELRGPNGAVIPTESIGIRDTEYVMSTDFSEDLSLYDVEAGGMSDPDADAEMMAEVEEFLAELEANEAWQGSSEESGEEKPSIWARYQIMVTLLDEADVP
jgi:hypothetical protein